jgi:hypothetical protein
MRRTPLELIVGFVALSEIRSRHDYGAKGKFRDDLQTQ